MKLFFGFLFVLVTSVSNGQLISDSLLIDGNYRTFHFHQPAQSVINGSLFFIMHGSGGSGKRFARHASKLEAIAAKENLLIVYPEGYKHYWNECRKFATSDANKENINEADFFKGMIRYFRDKYGINENKVVAAGFSGGGHMAYKLGLTMPDKIRAIAAIVANMPDSASMDCIPVRKALPVLIVNGTDDGTNPYKGGEMYVNNSSYGVVRSTDSSFHYWSTLAGYEGEAIKKVLPDTDPKDGKIIESYSYNDATKPAITLLKVVGGKHDYPNDIDVYLYAWDFFKSQVKEIGIGIADPAKRIQLVDAACGQCRLGLPGKSCDLAVRINGKAYFVDGTSIDDHGDAHASDGFCEAVRKAEVQGEIVNDRFKATYFKLREKNTGKQK